MTFIPLSAACKKVGLGVSAYRHRREADRPFPAFVKPGTNRLYVAKEDVDAYLEQVMEAYRRTREESDLCRLRAHEILASVGCR